MDDHADPIADTQGTNMSNFNLSDCIDVWASIETLRYPLDRESPVLKWALLTSYLTVSIIGALGNLLVITAVLHSPSLRSSARNYFIINLALSDLVMCTITAPFTLRLILISYWDLGEIGCKVVSSLLGANIFVSNLSVIAIGLDRFLMILFPTDVTYQRLAVFGCFLVVWLTSVSLALPLYISNDLVPLGSATIRSVCDVSVFVCGETSTSYFAENFKPYYYAGCFLLIYFTPLCSLIFLYGKILCRLGSRPNVQQQKQNRLRHQQPVTRQGSQSLQINLHKLLICLVVAYAVCWFPLMVYNVIVTMDLWAYELSTFAFSHVTGMLSTCLNPIIYGVFNKNFRNEFTVIYCRLTCRSYKMSQQNNLISTRPLFAPKNTDVPQSPTQVKNQINCERQSLLAPRTDSTQFTENHTMEPRCFTINTAEVNV